MRPWIRLCTLFSGGRPADHLAHRTVAHRLHTGLATLIGRRLKLSSHHRCKEIDGRARNWALRAARLIVSQQAGNAQQRTHCTNRE